MIYADLPAPGPYLGSRRGMCKPRSQAGVIPAAQPARPGAA
jgi:hypothetical protein